MLRRVMQAVPVSVLKLVEQGGREHIHPAKCKVRQWGCISKTQNPEYSSGSALTMTPNMTLSSRTRSKALTAQGPIPR